jgi:hypothetical protein
MRSEFTHVEIKHWCNKGTIEGAFLTVKGKTHESAISRWNTRATDSRLEVARGLLDRIAHDPSSQYVEDIEKVAIQALATLTTTKGE